MPKGNSPSHFNGEVANCFDSNFTVDISRKMRVPKNIRVSGDFSDEEPSFHSLPSRDNFDMNVPERILVVGQEQHLGTKAPPREIVLENSVIPQEPGLVQIQTPPRVLKLNEHYFPAVDEDESSTFRPEENDLENTTLIQTNSGRYNPETQIVRHARETTPAFGGLDVSLAPNEEIQHLRRQVGKLNRRVMAVELEMTQRQHREKIFYAITIAYFFLKAFSWITRN